MLMLIALLFGFVAQSTTYHLTVIGGSGSGNYTCGSTVTIIADRRHGSEVFAQWSAVPMGDATIDRVHQRKATVRNHNVDCRAVTVEAHFAPQPPKR